jgi:hypothetical protein
MRGIKVEGDILFEKKIYGSSQGQLTKFDQHDCTCRIQNDEFSIVVHSDVIVKHFDRTLSKTCNLFR